MEVISLRTVVITAVAPMVWGTTYIVTAEMLPPDRPLFSALVRALPVGLLLLAWRRRLPSGVWWWRSFLLGLCTIGLFFPLSFVAAYHLPSGLAATMQATAPLAVMGIAWALAGERPRRGQVLAAVVGLIGVALLVLGSVGQVDLPGLLGATGSVLVAALGFVLVRRWPPPVDMLTLVSWQLVAGGLVLLPVAFVVEGAPPPVDGTAIVGFLWLAVVGTGIAYACWFHGLTRMTAGSVSIIGLLNPVVGTLLGVLIAGEVFGWQQALGTALTLGGVVAGQPALAALVRRRRVRREAIGTPSALTATGTIAPPAAEMEHVR